MSKGIKIAVIGGDMRQVYAADHLSQEGYEVYSYGLSDMPRYATPCETYEMAIREARVILLPIPVTRDQLQISGTELSLASFLLQIDPGMIVFGGMPDPILIREIEARGAKVIDYAEDEVFKIQNALPTAEGAVAIAMGELRRTLFGSQALIVGYGRIGKLLGDLLRSMGCRVSIAARKATDLSLAQLHGCHPIAIATVEGNSILNIPSDFHVIFNTVPVRLIDERILRQLSRETVLIDLASLPGGIDYDAAGRLGLKTVIALSLPGKLTPITAGEIIAGRVTAYVEGGCNT